MGPHLSRKDKAELLLKLADTFWRDFDTRRSYEWKTNFALWAALSALLGILAKGDLRLSISIALICSIAVAVIFILYWLPWTTGMWRRNYEDQRCAELDWENVRELTHLDLREEQKPREKLIRSRKDYYAVWGGWSRGTQLGITLAFVLAIILVIWLPRILAIWFPEPPYCL